MEYLKLTGAQMSESPTRELVTTEEAPLVRKHVLVQPGIHPAREGTYFNRICTYKDIPHVLKSAGMSEIVAVDLETNGTDYSTQELQIIGIGLAWDRGSCYIPMTELYARNRIDVMEFLRTKTGLLAHNVYFDGGVLYSKLTGSDRHPHFLACTYALYRQCANEGWEEQRWGLKDAQISMLGWTETNETELDKWLILNGFYKGNRLSDDSLEHRQELYALDKLRPDKSQMYRAPKGILGKYCVLDAEACYLLYTRILSPVLGQFPGLAEHHQRFLLLIRLLVEQRCNGLLLDKEKLLAKDAGLAEDISQAEMDFLHHPDTIEHIKNIEEELLNELRSKEPEQFIKQKPLPKEPPRLKKSGEVSKNWLKWEQQVANPVPPVVSKTWINWREKYQDASIGKLPDYRFNPRSSPQMVELLYNRMGFVPKMFSPKGDPSLKIKALKQLGPVGEILVEHRYLSKDKGFTEDYLDRITSRPTIHPSFKCPGTVTDRLSSKDPNLQQVPKTKSMMSLFIAPPGKVWVDIDFAALESMVAAELSGDSNLYQLYGDNVPENDIHLFVASQVPGAMGDKVKATGYRAVNPPAGTVAKAKKECKAERSIAKTVVYACQFGAGVDKVMNTLEEDDIFLPRKQVEDIWNSYWKSFARLKQYSWELRDEWRANGGWVLNGMYRPMCVDADTTKDLLSRVVQSTGHDLLVQYIKLYTEELTARGIPWTPLIIDWHDASTVEVPEEHAEETVTVMNWAMARLNEIVDGKIKLRGIPTVGRNLAEIKEPEEE